MKKRIGWIGTGVMGKSMCLHLCKAGYPLTVFTRTRSKAAEVLEAGAVWGTGPAAIAESSDIMFTMVGMPSDVEEVVLGKDGLLQSARKGSAIVDMSTSEPSLARRIAELASGRGVAALDAPVSGGDVGAREATLAIMVGGEKKVFDETLPLFSLLGKNVSYMGPAGSGQHTKMCNQILVGLNLYGVVEALLYAHKSGLSPEEMIAVVSKGAANSFAVTNSAPRILAGNYNPGFYIKHFVKDMGIALAEARRMNLSLPGLALVNQFYISAMAMGYENLGTQAIYKVLASLNNMEA